MVLLVSIDSVGVGVGVSDGDGDGGGGGNGGSATVVTVAQLKRGPPLCGNGGGRRLRTIRWW